MKTATAPLIALIATGSFCTWDLYTITLAGGQVIRLCTAEFDVYDKLGNLFSCGSIGSGNPKVDSKSSRVTASIKAGLDPDQWQVQLLPTVTDPFTGAFTYPDVVGTTPWLVACTNGIFDGSSVSVQRAYFAAPPTQPYSVANRTCIGTTIEFIGYLGEIDTSNSVTVFSFTGWSGLLDQSMPRNLYQTGCNHQLFDAQCTLNPATFVLHGLVASSPGRSNLVSIVGAPSGSGTYILGKIIFTSGQNNGFSRLITSWDGGLNFGFLYPLPFDIGMGDSFDIYPGCDKSLGAKGCGGFANKINFGGNPYIPLPEMVLA